MNLVLESTLSAYKQDDSMESAKDLVEQLAQAHASQDLDDKVAFIDNTIKALNIDFDMKTAKWVEKKAPATADKNPSSTKATASSSSSATVVVQTPQKQQKPPPQAPSPPPAASSLPPAPTPTPADDHQSKKALEKKDNRPTKKVHSKVRMTNDQ
eukprot:1415924-Rhodomonas_salina.2